MKRIAGELRDLSPILPQEFGKFRHYGGFVRESKYKGSRRQVE
jgi:hypothetical protein